jgi:hypothetical protein
MRGASGEAFLGDISNEIEAGVNKILGDQLITYTFNERHSREDAHRCLCPDPPSTLTPSQLSMADKFQQPKGPGGVLLLSFSP